MTINEARDFFRELSGRRTMNDFLVDSYLTAGLNYLDDITEFQYSDARKIEYVTNGRYYISFTTPVKAITDVTLIDEATKEQVRLTPLSYKDILLLEDVLISSKTHGTPEYWAPGAFRRAPLGATVDPSDEFAINSSTLSTTNGVLFNCPVDQDYTVDIYGQFYSELTNNWWLDIKPLVLIYSGLYKLELGYRNKEGANDWLNAMEPEIVQINFNRAHQDSFNINQMEG
jgi:hypothetical protein